MCNSTKRSHETSALNVNVDIVRVLRYNNYGKVYSVVAQDVKGDHMSQSYMSLKEAAEKWGIGDRRINTLCLQNRIPGAFKIGNTWAIPVDAEKPIDARIKTGKYIIERRNSDGTK